MQTRRLAWRPRGRVRFLIDMREYFIELADRLEHGPSRTQKDALKYEAIIEEWLESPGASDEAIQQKLAAKGIDVKFSSASQGRFMLRRVLKVLAASDVLSRHH
jgi:hypothetical protein